MSTYFLVLVLKLTGMKMTGYRIHEENAHDEFNSKPIFFIKSAPYRQDQGSGSLKKCLTHNRYLVNKHA